MDISSGISSKYFGGTSAAAPLAAGIGALLLSKNTNFTAEDVRLILERTADKIGIVTYDTNGFNQYYGYGRVNAGNALATQTLYWDYNGDASGIGGTGTWNPLETTPRWRVGSSTGQLTTWIPGSDVVFSGNPGTYEVTVSGSVSVNNMTFSIGGYTLTSGTLLVSSSGISIAVAQSNTTATIGSAISGSGTLTKSGYGTLSLTGNSASTYSGNANIQLGILELRDSGNLAAHTNVAVSSYATLQIYGGSHALGSINGNYNSTVLITNSGALTVDSVNTSTLTVGAGCTLTIRALPGGPFPASVQSVTSPNSNGTYSTGDTILVDVAFDVNVNVTGAPMLRLDTGDNEVYATYLSGSGTSTLRFDYTVQAGDNTSDLDYWGTWSLMLNGGTIQTDSQADAFLALARPGDTGSLGASSNLDIQTPYLSTSGAESIAEGKSYTLQLAAGNLGSRTIDSWEIDWGDGNIDTYTTNPTQVTHIYADDGYYVITSSATLDDETYIAGGQSGTHAVNVINVAPYLSIRGEPSVAEGAPYTLHLSSSDPGDDTISSWEINWGDGNIQTVDSNPSSVEHYYANTGSYSISATATDEDGTYNTGGLGGGALDPTFGEGGMVTTPIFDMSNPDGLSQCGRSMAIQPDGKIIVVGDGDLGCYYLARYNTDGSLDTTFGIGGIITTDNPARAVALQADGKILVAGTWTNGGAQNGDFSLVRYNPDGSLDLSFGSGGKVLTDIAAGSSDSAYALVVQTDGKIVLTGSSNGNLALVRYNTDGSLDVNFGSAGIVTIDFGSANSIAIQSDGKIVVAGSYNGDFALARFNTDGSLDTNFDGDGKLTTDFGGTDIACSVAIQSDGKIIAAGYPIVSSQPNCFALARYNTDGSLDASFDVDGKLTTNFGGINLAYSVAIQSDGKIVAAGMANGNFALARYNTDGSLDTNFDSDGKLTTDFVFGSSDIGAAVGIQSDGKIIVVGYAGSNYSDFALARYNTDGSLDNTFDGDGKATTSFGSNDYAFASAIQSYGKIILAGYTGSDSSDFALVRYNTDGSLDTTFDDDGKLTTDFGSDDRVYAVAIQSDGKIVVAGTSDGNFALARYNSDGSLDDSFDGDGKLTTDFGSSDSANALVIQSDGKIVVAGSSNGNFALARYNSDGSLDTTFDSDGKLTTDFGSSDSANAMVIQSDGKIIVAGTSNSDFALARYNTDGSLDTNFDSDGKLTTNIGISDYAYAVSIQSDGKIIVAGKSGLTSSSDFALARYNSDGSLDTSFGSGGKLTTNFGSRDCAYSVAIQSDGKILVAGNTGSTYSDFALARYNTDGSLDTSFDGDGKLTLNLGGADYGRSIILQSDGRIVVAGYAMNDFAIARFFPGVSDLTVTVY